MHSPDKISTYLSLHLPSLRPADCTHDGRETNSLTADLVLLHYLWSGPVICPEVDSFFLATLDIREGSDKNHSLLLWIDLDEKTASLRANNMM